MQAFKSVVAGSVPFDNSTSDLISTEVQSAIEEVNNKVEAPKINTVIGCLQILADSSFTIKADASMRITAGPNATNQKVTILGSVQILSNSSMKIEANSSVTVLGV